MLLPNCRTSRFVDTSTIFQLPKPTNANTHEKEKLTFFMKNVMCKRTMFCTRLHVDCLCATLSKQNIFQYHIVQADITCFHFKKLISFSASAPQNIDVPEIAKRTLQWLVQPTLKQPQELILKAHQLSAFLNSVVFPKYALESILFRDCQGDLPTKPHDPNHCLAVYVHIPLFANCSFTQVLNIKI